ncbi:hypothetical protein WUBG_12646 [Wuchereria bancrofti]|uniref:Uncharacterized protein n=1 Tax=Wuchereria bancrofti TaxID=6293 RepID=J9E2H5_WUCBA|nr:hypothetical protein WUBG_12646 [Wuchereria bancrofti]
MVSPYTYFWSDKLKTEYFHSEIDLILIACKLVILPAALPLQADPAEKPNSTSPLPSFEKKELRNLKRSTRQTQQCLLVLEEQLIITTTIFRQMKRTWMTSHRLCQNTFATIVTLCREKKKLPRYHFAFNKILARKHKKQFHLTANVVLMEVLRQIREKCKKQNKGLHVIFIGLSTYINPTTYEASFPRISKDAKTDREIEDRVAKGTKNTHSKHIKNNGNTKEKP